MKRIDTKRIATNGLLFILSLVILFHGLVLIGVVPFQIVWGGRLKDASQMLVFETVSIGINVLMLTVVGVHAGFIKVKLNPMIIRGALWIMGVIFLLNTLGNLFAVDPLERLIFTPLTLLLSLGSFRLAMGNYPADRAHSRKTLTKSALQTPVTNEQ